MTDTHEIHAIVTRAFFCANHITEGQRFVFDLKGRLDPVRSDANLCLGILAKLQPALLLAQESALVLGQGEDAEVLVFDLQA